MRQAVQVVLITMICFCVVAIFVGLSDVFPPSERGSGSRERNRDCLNQFGEAFHQHHSAKDAFPPGTIVDANGHPLYGWHVSLLPYVEQDSLYKSFDKSRPWDDPVNQAHARRDLRVYRHDVAGPTDSQGYGITTYAGNSRVLGGSIPRKLSDFEAATWNVLLVGEVPGNFQPWASTNNLRDPGLGLNRHVNGFGPTWSKQKVTCFVMADGGVRSFRNDTDPEFVQAMADPFGR